MYKCCCSRSWIPNSRLKPTKLERSLDETDDIDNIFQNCLLDSDNSKNLSTYYSQHIEASILVDTSSIYTTSTRNSSAKHGNL